MPPRNRKKNKGKERKAKKEADRVKAEKAKVHALWLGLASGHKKYCGRTITCDHGCAPCLSQDHPVSNFMDEFITYWNSGCESTTEMIVPTIKSHSEVWNNERYREMVVKIMTRMGTNMLISARIVGTNMLLKDHECIFGALHLARAISVFENHDCKFRVHTTLNSSEVATKMRDFRSNVSSYMRDALKFFSKRITCSCLNAIHQNARKTITKTGLCCGCDKEFKRVALSVCSRCMITQYCSRECQVADWHDHERDCNLYVNARKLRRHTVDA